MRKLRAADLFCGAGGTTAGAVASGAVDAVFALNHWDVAIQTHSANFPGAKHVNSRLDMTSPSECPKIDLLFASPECTHHSRARGGRPTSDQQRSGAWDVIKWIEFHRPSFVVIENVVEWKDWGPVGDNGRPLKSKKGSLFNAWINTCKEMGYREDVRELNAADFDACTSRNRLFVILKKGNRLPRWPEPVRTRFAGGELPGMSLPAWRAAAEIIDWNVPCPSIFQRKRPLADNTLQRLEAGLRRFVAPFVTQWDNTSVKDPSRSLGSPLATMVTKANMGLCIPFQYQLIGRGAGISRDIGSPVPTMLASRESHGIALPFMAEVNHSGGDRVRSLHEGLGTIATHNGMGMALPYIVPHFGEREGQSPRTHDINAALPTVTGQGAGSLAIPWLSSFYGNETSVPASSPVATITTKDRHSLCIAIARGPQDWPEPTTDAMRALQATMRELGVNDLLFRMLQNHELAAAQGFSQEYRFCGTKADVTRQIGNSVSPPVAMAISKSIAG